MHHYAFGYGSLIQSGSRLRTVPTAHNVIPVRFAKMQRGWWLHGSRRSLPTTYLAVELTDNPKHTCNGVLLKMNDDEMAALDRREQGYDRVELDINDVTYLSGAGVVEPDSTLWTYVCKPARGRERPTAEQTLLQSYVDICLLGCLEMEDLLGPDSGFIREFIDTTLDWSAYWRNDRDEEDFTRLGDRQSAVDAIVDDILPVT